MNIEATIDEASLKSATDGVTRDFEKLQVPVQNAMAEKFFQIVRLNFGNFGIDRPIEWPPLSPAYAKKVGREHATLFVSGALEAAVKTDSSPESSRVYVSDSDVSYATSHQWGVPSRNLPARPFFPVDAQGDVTPFTFQEVQQSAQDEVARLLTT
jgi:phage gpG-like protein